MKAYGNIEPEYVILLILYGTLFILGFLKYDDSSTRHDSLDHYYQAMLESDTKKGLDSIREEELWGEAQKLQKIIQEEEKARDLQRVHLIHKVLNIVVSGHKIEETEDSVTVFYIVNILKADGRVAETTHRRYREFATLYQELKQQQSHPNLPPFPPRMTNKSQVTDEVILQRQRAFDLLLKYIVSEAVQLEGLSLFLRPNAEVPYYGTRNRVDSLPPKAEPATEQHSEENTLKRLEQSSSYLVDLQYQAKIANTYETGPGYSRYTMYEISVQLGNETTECAHRFKDFKKLYEHLKSRFGRSPELPISGLYASSTDSKVVAQRKLKLEDFLREILSDVDMRGDPTVVSFLSLEKLI